MQNKSISSNLGRAALLMLVACVPLAAQQNQPPSGTSVPVVQAAATAPVSVQTTATFQDRYPRYHIQAADAFDLKFEFSPEFDQTVTVQPDGFVSLRGIGDLHVADYTQPQLKEALRQAYGKILYEPTIEVILKDFEKPYFVADGQVGHPGKYDLRGSTTLTQAIAVAGGFSAGAKSSQVLLFRRVDDQWSEARVIDVQKMRGDRSLKEDTLMRPGDMIFIPKSFIGKIEKYLPSTSIGTFLRPF